MRAGRRRLDGLGDGCGPLWLTAGAAVLVAGLVLLLDPYPGSPALRQVAAAPAQLASAAETASPAADPTWSGLSHVERQALDPLKGIWPTLTAEQRDEWRLVVDRFQSKPRQAQRRLAARVAEWARLSPQQRATARLNFLELATHYSPKQRQEQWQAYQRSKPDKAASAASATGRLPPARVQASPGATTVLLSQLFDLSSLNAGAGRSDAAVDAPQGDGVGLQGGAAASAASSDTAEPTHGAP